MTTSTPIGAQGLRSAIKATLVFGLVLGLLLPVSAEARKKKKEEAIAAEAAPSAKFTGPKKIIAVNTFEGTGKMNWDEGGTLSAMLSGALLETGRFNVVERTALQSVLREQDMSAHGLMSQQTAIKAGRLLGAAILVQGTVTDFGETSGGKGTVTVPLPVINLRLGGKKRNAVVVFDFRLIDTTTGQILLSESAEEKMSAKGVDLGVFGTGSFDMQTFKKSLIGKTSRKAIDKAVAAIVTRMEKVKFSARVMKAEGKTVYVNAGANRNIKPGILLTAYKSIEDLVDPDTGIVLERIEEKTATVKIETVEEKYSIGILVEGATPAKGDTLRLE